MLILDRRIKTKLHDGCNLNRILSCLYLRLTLKTIRLFLILAISVYPILFKQTYGQEISIEQTEDKLNKLFGLEKLIALNVLTGHYDTLNSRKAVKYGKQAVSLGENIFTEANTNVDLNERPHLVKAYLQLGKIYYEQGDYFDSQENLQAAKSLSIQISDTTYLDEAEIYLSEIQALIDSGEIKESFFSKTFGNLKVGEAISNTSKDLTIQTEIKMAENNAKKGDFEGAIKHYEKAINLLRNEGDAERISELQLQIGVLLDSLDRHEEAQEFLGEAIQEIDPDSLATNQARDSIPRSVVMETEPEKTLQDSLRTEQQHLKELSDNYAREKDYEKSLAYYKLYQDLSLRMEADSLYTIAENKRREGEILLLRQQKKIADLNVQAIESEKEEEIRLRNTLVLLALLILLGTLVTLYFYFAKRRKHKRLTIAYRDLDKTKSKLVEAEQKIGKLLGQQVSVDVAKELLMNSSDKPGERRFVAIMFLDIRDFTPMAEKLSPEELIAFQNNVFGFMIDIIQQYNGNINQLLGDGFMATFGAPVSRGNDCQNAYLAAKEILREVEERNEAGVIQKTKIGIGLHAGFVVTGNVGNEARKQYSITGNPVIIASRMEQLNKTYHSRLIITEEVYTKLDNPPQLTEDFLEVKVKGRSNPVKIVKFA